MSLFRKEAAATLGVLGSGLVALLLGFVAEVELQTEHYVAMALPLLQGLVTRALVYARATVDEIRDRLNAAAKAAQSGVTEAKDRLGGAPPRQGYEEDAYRF